MEPPAAIVSLMLDAPFSIAQAAHMYSGAKTGLVLTDIQQEQQELKKRDQEIAFEGKNVEVQRPVETHFLKKVVYCN